MFTRRALLSLSFVVALSASGADSKSDPVNHNRSGIAGSLTGTPVGSLNAFAWMDAGTVPVVGSPAYEEIRYAGDEDAIAWLFARFSSAVPHVIATGIGVSAPAPRRTEPTKRVMR